MCSDSNKKGESWSVSSQTLMKLINRAQDGDKEAFRDWLDKTYRIVNRLIVRTLGDEGWAEDVVQEVYTRAWESIKRIKQPEFSLQWVCRIARNVAADRLRHLSRHEAFMVENPGKLGISILMNSLLDPEPSPEAKALSKEDRARVRSALTSLKPKHRVVLLMREVDGLSYDDIATVMDLPRGTIESRVHRAKAKLKKILKKLP
jgi:RNA polymerase sigma-70 factor (ECF subfamily)